MSPEWAGVWHVGLLIVAVTLTWCAHYDRWSIASWSVPLEYRGDAPEILAQMRAAADGDMWPFRPKIIERLGAPFGAHWNAFPTPDKPLLLLVGGLTHLVGLFAAANIVMLLGSISSALAFYFVARWLRCRWEWAWAGALLYAFTYHTFHRGLGHFSIAFTWTVPLALLAVWLVAQSRRLEWRSSGAAVCLGSAVAVGVSNPYNLLFWVQLMGFALIAQWFSRRRRANLTIGVATVLIAGVAFIASHLEVWVFVQEPEGAPLVMRNYAGTEIYALKPIEMFIPPRFHRSDVLAFMGHRYERWSAWRGEAFLPYVGLAGIAALLWLGLVTARRIFLRRPLPGHALSIGWLIAYSSIGGVTNVLALLAGFQIFRATNRVAIFISAIAIVFLIVRMSRLTARWPAWLRGGLAFAVAGIGVLDQVPRPEPPDVVAEIEADAKSDLNLGRELEAALPPGAAIFQLPIMGFPEVSAPNLMADYELFRPYLVTETLRFSYGAAKSRARSRWQRDIERVPAATLVRRLEEYGFSAVYVNRKAFKDRAEGLLGELAALGYHQRIESARGHQTVVLLNPAARPTFPLARTLTYGLGWHTRILEGVKWANSDAILSYFNPYDRRLPASLELIVEAVSERDVWIERDGRELGRIHAGKVPIPLRVPRLDLEPGVNVFELRSNQPGRRLGTGQYQLRTFGLHDLFLKVDRPDKTSK
ncbi:MAG: hypothetical protein Q7S40_04810 [Opitutaceae bacterium]|nr:hypothetical protein [Opitutaceae bacterium]